MWTVIHTFTYVEMHESPIRIKESCKNLSNDEVTSEIFGTVSHLSALAFMCAAKQLVQTNRQPPAGAFSCTPTLFSPHTQMHLNPPPPQPMKLPALLLQNVWEVQTADRISTAKDNGRRGPSSARLFCNHRPAEDDWSLPSSVTACWLAMHTGKNKELN